MSESPPDQQRSVGSARPTGRWALRGLATVAVLAEVVIAYVLAPLPVAIATALGAVSLLLVWKWPYIPLILNFAIAWYGGPSPVALDVAYFMIIGRTGLRWTALVPTTIALIANAQPWRTIESGELALYLFVSALGTAVVGGLGLLIFTRQKLVNALAELHASTDREKAVSVQLAVEAERTLIAREMHDVVSHQVSLIAVQAGALSVLSPEESVKNAAQTIRQLSANTLTELRYLLKVLRQDPTELISAEPQPGVDQLANLIAESGIEVETTLSVTKPLEPVVQRALFRIVQEALTNIHKHATGSSAQLRLVTDEDSTILTIENGPALSSSAPSLPGSGHGLLGIHERVEILGGQFKSGPTAYGGYRLHIKIPATA
jgi:signal transduction histidine kinase